MAQSTQLLRQGVLSLFLLAGLRSMQLMQGQICIGQQVSATMIILRPT